MNSECDVECRRLAPVQEVQAAIVQSDRPLAADWSDIWAHSAAVDQFFDGARSRSGSSASIGSIALFLPRQTTGTWRSRPSTEIFSFLAKSFSLAPHAVAQCFEDNHLSLAVSGSESAMLGVEVKFAVARWTLLVAMSGAGKALSRQWCGMF